MDARPKTRRVDRERNAPAPQPPRGAKQIVIPLLLACFGRIGRVVSDRFAGRRVDPSWAEA